MRNTYGWLSCVLALWLGLAGPARAQRVGLVLSGGGAKGLAHIGVLKVLEQNGIPVDYIVGTSMGAVVGGMYAAGYSPAEIERVALSPEFQYWVSGKQPEGQSFNYVNADASPGALNVSVSVDSTLRVTPNLIDDVGLNFALARLLAPGAAAAHYSYDRLLVPFRCLAAEVFTRREIVQRRGPLALAVRNSMAVPLVFRPIRNPDGRYLFDGGVFNNFPTDIMKAEFKPDVIVGVNVGDVAYKKYPFKKDDQLLAGTLLFLGLNVADTTSVGPNGVFIQPDLESFGAGDFDKVAPLIARGTAAAKQKLPQLLGNIARRQDTLALARQRAAFLAREPKLVFNQIKIVGLGQNQDKYVRSFFRRAGALYSLDEVREGYYRLASNAFFRNVYPRFEYDSAARAYTLNLDARQNNNLSVSTGFVLSTRPIDNIYLGLRYQFLNRFLYSTTASVNLGRFYNAGEAQFRVTLPLALPFYLEPAVTLNQWSYQKTSGLLNRNVDNTLIEQRDLAARLQIGVSPNFRSVYTLEGGYFSNQDRYANGTDVSSGTVLDRTRFRGATAVARFSRNSLNRKQYATLGRRVLISVRGVRGTEDYAPGSTATVAALSRRHQWLQLAGSYEQFYALPDRKSNWGYYAGFVLSGQGRFANYRSSLTTAPVFAPLVDSRTLFLDNYRQPRYAAAGLRYSRQLIGKVEWRSEAYAHLIYQPLRLGADQQAVKRSGFDRPHLTASTGFVYDTPVGPLSVQLIHYDDPSRRWSVFAHLGYLLFHGRALE